MKVCHIPVLVIDSNSDEFSVQLFLCKLFQYYPWFKFFSLFQTQIIQLILKYQNNNKDQKKNLF